MRYAEDGETLVCEICGESPDELVMLTPQGEDDPIGLTAMCSECIEEVDS